MTCPSDNTLVARDFDETDMEMIRRGDMLGPQLGAKVATALEASYAENERLTEALRPFANYLDTAHFDLDNKGNPLPDEQGMGWTYLTVGDFRRARTALKDSPK